MVQYEMVLNLPLLPLVFGLETLFEKTIPAELLLEVEVIDDRSILHRVMVFESELVMK
jgi:hypothetical protein